MNFYNLFERVSNEEFPGWRLFAIYSHDRRDGKTHLDRRVAV